MIIPTLVDGPRRPPRGSRGWRRQPGPGTVDYIMLCVFIYMYMYTYDIVYKHIYICWCRRSAPGTVSDECSQLHDVVNVVV